MIKALEDHKLIKMRHFNKCGIYFLFRRGVLVYIGQSKNIYSRVINHNKEKSKDFDSFSYHLLHENQLNSTEEYLIKKYQPEYNSVHATSGDMSDKSRSILKKAKIEIETARKRFVSNQSFTDTMVDGF